MSFCRLCHCLSWICILFLVGCAGLGTEPLATTPVATNTVLPKLRTATATEEMIAAKAFPTFRIKNAQTATYLYEDEGRAKVGDISASDKSSQWLVEDYQGSKRLKNAASRNYLSIENLKDYVEVIPIFPEWMSPRWVFDGDPVEGSIVIRNVWHNWQVLYVEDGSVKYERVPITADNARWVLESTDGKVLVTSASTPIVTIPPAHNPAGSRGAAVPWI